MIPKIIHYCWFGKKPLPPLAKKCIASWKRYLPEYEIKEWNEDNFDIDLIPYTSEAYKNGKYAFVSDYARFWILYNYGGLYFDTDVEVIMPLNDIIAQGAFMGFENNGYLPDESNSGSSQNGIGVNPGLGLGVESGHELYKEILDYYANEHFILYDGSMNQETVGIRVTSIMQNHGLCVNNRFQNVEGVNIYPPDFFSPIRITDGKLCLTNNTVSIHHYSASWMSPTYKFLRKVILFVGGVKFKNFIAKMIGKNK